MSNEFFHDSLQQRLSQARASLHSFLPSGDTVPRYTSNLEFTVDFVNPAIIPNVSGGRARITLITPQIDCSTSCDLDARNGRNSLCGSSADQYKSQSGLRGTQCDHRRHMGPVSGDRTALCLQIRPAIQKSIKIFIFVSGARNLNSKNTVCACLPLFLFVG